MNQIPIQEVLDYFRSEDRLRNVMQYRAGVLEDIINATHPETKARRMFELARVDNVLRGLYKYSNYGERNEQG